MKRLIFYINVLILFASCLGQNNSEIITGNLQGKLSAISVGDTVLQIDKSIWQIFQSRNNNYWFGSNGSGVYCYDGKILKQFTTKQGLISNQIRGIQEDSLGNMFFDTPGGVSKFDGQKFSLLIPIDFPNHKWELKPSDLWFKGNGDIKGAYQYDGYNLYQLNFSAFSTKVYDDNYGVYSLYRDNQGNMWFGTLSAGICRFDGTSLNWIYEKEMSVLEDGRVPAVRSIIEDKDGIFWASNILYKYKVYDNDLKALKAIKYDKLKGVEPSKQQVNMTLPYSNSALVDNGNLWMTNYSEGVWKYDGQQLFNYIIKDGETKALVVSIYKDKQGTLWVATDNAGVYKFNGKGFEKLSLFQF
jgi:ligand-binding sensor domain-containing protein